VRAVGGAALGGLGKGHVAVFRGFGGLWFWIGVAVGGEGGVVLSGFRVGGDSGGT